MSTSKDYMDTTKDYAHDDSSNEGSMGSVKLESNNNENDSSSSSYMSNSDDKPSQEGSELPTDKQDMSNLHDETIPYKGKKDNKKCAVCGDKALGFNFGAITCESCKAFFRRNASKKETLSCIFENKCKIDMHTRRFCTYCRLRKCFDASMNKEYILGDEEKRMRREKLRHSRERQDKQRSRQRSTVSPSLKLSTTSGQGLPIFGLTTSLSSGRNGPVFDLPGPLSLPLSSPASANSATQRQHLNSTSTSPCLFDFSAIELGLSCDAGHIACGGVEDAWSGDASVILPSFYPQCPTILPNENARDQVTLNEEMSKEGKARQLTRDQWVAINDLRQAYDSSFTIIDRTPGADSSLNSLVNTSGYIVRNLINFAKKLSDFSNLSQDCQIGLLKGVVLNTLFLLSATHYDVAKDVWITPQGEIPTRILMFATGLNVLYEEHAKYCRSFRALVGQDAPLIALMQVLVLFQSDRPTVSERQQVSNVHDRYVLLLKHYLEAKYGFAGARPLLANILGNLANLDRLTESHGGVLLHVDPREVDPLMLEVFNLNDLSRFTSVVGGKARNSTDQSSIGRQQMESMPVSSSIPNDQYTRQYEGLFQMIPYS